MLGQVILELAPLGTVGAAEARPLAALEVNVASQVLQALVMLAAARTRVAADAAVIGVGEAQRFSPRGSVRAQVATTATDAPHACGKYRRTLAWA